MSKIAKLTLCVTVSVLLLGAYFVVSAASSAPSGPSTKNIAVSSLPSLHLPPNGFEGLRGNFITTATGSFVLAAGFTQEDLVLWQCGSTGASTCTLVVNSFATTSGGGVANDDRALCLVVDGAIVGACAYDGYDTADGSYSAINAINNVAGLSAGNHSSEMLIYSTYGTTLYTLTNVYSVYKP